MTEPSIQKCLCAYKIQSIVLAAIKDTKNDTADFNPVTPWGYSSLSLPFRKNDLPLVSLLWPHIPSSAHTIVGHRPPTTIKCQLWEIQLCLCSRWPLLIRGVALSLPEAFFFYPWAVHLLTLFLSSSLLNFWYSPEFRSHPFPSHSSLFIWTLTAPSIQLMLGAFLPIYRDWSAALTLLLARGCLHLPAPQHLRFNRFKFRPIICFSTIPLRNTFLPLHSFSQQMIPSFTQSRI